MYENVDLTPAATCCCGHCGGRQTAMRRESRRLHHGAHASYNCRRMLQCMSRFLALNVVACRD
jgi:hypothetical protein